MSEPSWDEARSLAHAAIAPGATVSLPIADALGTTTVRDVLALAPMPHADTSAMDGWAVAGAGPWRLDPGLGPLAAGWARAIVTGGVPPEGADAVVPTELGVLTGDALDAPTPEPGRHVRPAGEEARAADVLVPAGRVLGASELALAANTGHDQLEVRRPPRIRLLVTGDELDSRGVPAPGRVRDVMTPMLPPLLAALGAVVETVVSIADDPTAVAAEAGAPADLVVSAGGTGRSASDPIAGAWTKLGAEIRFRGVDMRPGHPASLAIVPDGRPWLALPGNPLAAVLTALSFVPPLVAGHGGRPVPAPLPAVAAAPFTGKAGTTLVPAVLTAEGVTPVGLRRPHQLRGLAAADVVAVVHGSAEPGAVLGVLPRVW